MPTGEPTLDGLGEYYRQVITESDERPADVAQALRDCHADAVRAASARYAQSLR